MPDESIRLIHASGECEIDLARRELRILGSPVPVGGRAFEIIEVLARSAGELVTKDELMDRIWPGAVVMESTLHVHAAAIRKALGPNRSLLKTESGRGYRLLGDWTVRRQEAAQPPVGVQRMRLDGLSPVSNFPATVTCLIGRTAAVARLRDLISAYRVVTLTGPGGIGKTSLALKVARGIVGGFTDGGWLVELTSLTDPAFVPAAVAAALRLRPGPESITPEAVARGIADRNVLLLLDNCEHLVEAVASLAETVIALCPHAAIVATSREILRIEGEHVFRVPPLEVPPPGLPGTEHPEPGNGLVHSAPELFIARARALGADFPSDSLHSSTIAAICRRLDGIPLAIEFAAARAATLGVEQVFSLLDNRFALLTSGRRTAFPKDRTLRATLDWSYELLSGPEQLLLRRLATFAAAFSLEAASAVTGSGEATTTEFTDGIVNLVAKSLLTTDPASGPAHFRLLETTRAYALERLTASGELQFLARRHAEYYRGLLEAILGGRETGPASLADLGNVRAALEWCFGQNGDAATGVGLAAAFAPVFPQLTMLAEHHLLSKRAILALGDVTRGGSEERRLQANLGATSMFMEGQSDAARVALRKSLAIAEACGDVVGQVESLSVLAMFQSRGGDFKTALHYARLGRALAETADDATAKAIAQSILGRLLHFAGDHRAAQVELEASLRNWPVSGTARRVQHVFHRFFGAEFALAKTLWSLGHPVQATKLIGPVLKDVTSVDRMMSVLIWAVSIFLETGDLPNAEVHADWLISHAETNPLPINLAAGRGYKAVLAIRRGDVSGGVARLRTCLEQLHTLGYELLNSEFRIALAQGLRAIGQSDESITLIDQTIRLIEVNGDYCHMPEALRVKGGILLSLAPPKDADAELCFTQSLEWSRRQSARAWELRTATDLATLFAERAEPERARAILRPVFAQFNEGLDTADLKAARSILATFD